MITCHSNVQCTLPCDDDVAGCTTAVFDLFAVSNHSGSMVSGHYTAYSRHPYSAKWHCFNDARSVASPPPRAGFRPTWQRKRGYSEFLCCVDVRLCGRLVTVLARTVEGPGFESWFGHLSRVHVDML